MRDDRVARIEKLLKLLILLLCEVIDKIEERDVEGKKPMHLNKTIKKVMNFKS